MKSFSQFLVEKEDFIINSKGERVPISKATRQDVGMAPKDLENVTPDKDIGLGKADPSKNLKGQSSDVKTKRENIAGIKKKFIKDKLNGRKLNTVIKPIKKGIKYNTKKRFFNSLFKINLCNSNISFLLFALNKNLYFFYDCGQINEQVHAPKVY